MAQPPPLSGSLIRKGEARAVSPEQAVAAPRVHQEEAPAAAPPVVQLAPAEVPRPAPRSAQELESVLDDLTMPEVVPLVMVSFRAPVKLAEELRLMAFETRRPKQDILTDLLAEGLKRWKSTRAKRVR
jgi:hypothetical protein